MHTPEARKPPKPIAPARLVTLARVSSDFRVTIPKDLRTRLSIKPGQRLHIAERNGSIVLTPVTPDHVEYLRGIFKGKPSMTEELLRERARDTQYE
ncbi:MAG: AbrB/MazE/SpoVT family DNA-binding domain-containing protein [Armatimonadetes bacterium]|nr:AbrB/MazE/SpoVT family DNA-binding domain-containing protein [Armatimonadota bacterium]